MHHLCSDYQVDPKCTFRIHITNVHIYIFDTMSLWQIIPNFQLCNFLKLVLALKMLVVSNWIVHVSDKVKKKARQFVTKKLETEGLKIERLQRQKPSQISEFVYDTNRPEDDPSDPITVEEKYN